MAQRPKVLVGPALDQEPGGQYQLRDFSVVGRPPRPEIKKSPDTRTWVSSGTGLHTGTDYVKAIAVREWGHNNPMKIK